MCIVSVLGCKVFKNCWVKGWKVLVFVGVVRGWNKEKK